MHRIKRLVALQNSNDRHRVIFTCLHDYTFGNPPGQLISLQKIYLDLLCHVENQLGDRCLFIEIKTHLLDWMKTSYTFIFDVIDGNDAVMLKLAGFDFGTITVFRYVKPERFPGENRKRHTGVVQYGYRKQKQKGIK